MIVGIALGTVLWAVTLFLMMAVNYPAAEAWHVSSDALYIGESLLVAALAIAAIAHPRTRQLGAGLLLGVAIGSVVWSGLCAIIGTGL